METEELTTIKLGGELGKKFGRVHKFVVGSVAEAVSAMKRMIPGFERELMTSKDRGISYVVFNGDKNIGKDNLADPVRFRSIRIIPKIQGSKSGGVFQTILGVVLVVVGAIITGGTFGAGAPFGSAVIMLGVSMMIGGVIQLLSPQPAGFSAGTLNQGGPNNGASYNFNGPVNTTLQGNPVPLLYGRMIVGSAVISAGIYSADRP